MKLRPYQQELYDNVRNEIIKGHKSVVAVLGCGGGKSVIQAAIAKSATSKGNKVLFLVHRRELCQQIADTFVRCGVDLNLCYIEMVQTVSRRINKTVWKPHLIITDECHHSLSKTYKKIYEHYSDAIRVGFTATPTRLGEGGLGEIYTSMVEGVSTEWLIKNGYLAPYEYYSVKLVETDGLRTRAGEFIASDVNELMNKNFIYGEALEHWRKLANGKKTIIYCSSIDASLKTVDEFRNHGINAAHLDGTTPDQIRRQTIKDFRDGKITVLSNVDLFGEGFDVPDCECVILLRPTMSLTLHIQQSMRSMRYKQNKTAIIIDHVGNVYRHGLPDDERVWSLAAKKKKEKTEIKIKQCPMCFAVVPASHKNCDICGHEFVITKQEREEAERKQAELERISRQDMLKNKPYTYIKELKTWSEIEEFRKAKGYKFGWSIRQCVEKNIDIPEKYRYMAKRFYAV